MSIQWNDLRFLLAVGRAGSLAAAAKALGVNKATVSRRVAALEEELGTALLSRGASGYELTDDGETALGVAQKVDQLVEELGSRIGDGDRALAGAVRVTAPAWFVQRVMVPELERFNQRHPRLEVLSIATEEVLDIARRAADIGVRNCKPEQESLLTRRVGFLGFALYAATSYLDRRGRPESPRELERHHLIAFHDTVTYIEGYEWLNSLPSPIAFRANDTAAQVDATVAGLGIALLPCFLADPMDELEHLAAIQSPAMEAVYTVMPPELRQVARVRAVADWIAELFVRHEDAFAGPRG